MTDEKTKKKNKKRFYPKNKEQASQKSRPKRNLEDSLKELQAFINSNYHAD